jgi:hypothetical protein
VKRFNLKKLNELEGKDIKFQRGLQIWKLRWQLIVLGK